MKTQDRTIRDVNRGDFALLDGVIEPKEVLDVGKRGFSVKNKPDHIMFLTWEMADKLDIRFIKRKYVIQCHCNGVKPKFGVCRECDGSGIFKYKPIQPEKQEIAEECEHVSWPYCSRCENEVDYYQGMQPHTTREIIPKIEKLGNFGATQEMWLKLLTRKLDEVIEVVNKLLKE